MNILLNAILVYIFVGSVVGAITINTIFKISSKEEKNEEEEVLTNKVNDIIFFTGEEVFKFKIMLSIIFTWPIIIYSTIINSFTN